jgi:hypothetical protein
MQGCLGIVWLGAVGIDWTRTSNVSFKPFENSWLAVPYVGPSLGVVRSITVRPFAGDPVMGERWITVFRDITDRRVMSQPDAIEGIQPASAAPQVDCVLIGNVIGQEAHNSFMGFKETSFRRLYLRLMTDSGVLLWRTELPYTIVTGTKDLNEEIVMKALLTHVRTHANEIGLAGLGRTTTQVASQEHPPFPTD